MTTDAPAGVPTEAVKVSGRSAAPARLSRGELVAPGAQGQPLELRNWNSRVWREAAGRAGVKAVPYDGRHTYASLLIHEGRSPPYVAAALGTLRPPPP